MHQIRPCPDGRGSGHLCLTQVLQKQRGPCPCAHGFDWRRTGGDVHTAHSTWRSMDGSDWISSECYMSWTPPVCSQNMKRQVSHGAFLIPSSYSKSDAAHRNSTRCSIFPPSATYRVFPNLFLRSFFSSALACSSAFTSSLHFVSARYCVLSSTSQHVKSHMRQLRVVWFEGTKRGLLRKSRGQLRAGVRYQKTDDASQIT